VTTSSIIKLTREIYFKVITVLQFGKKPNFLYNTTSGTLKRAVSNVAVPEVTKLLLLFLNHKFY
jgi:hypothetical protein